jgi:predicted MFS family arabinose efflux permease
MFIRTRREDQSTNRFRLVDAAIVIAAGVLATSLAQPQILAGIPLENLLKNELHVDRAANAAFFFWASLAWYFKPIVGIFTDSFPLWGTRRKSYLLVGTLLAVLSWVGLYFTPHEYHRLLWVTITINIFMVVASTAVGAYMVEIAQAFSGTGRLAAVRNVVEQICLIISGPGAGFLASVAFGWTTAMCGGVMFLLVPVTLIFLREPVHKSSSAARLSKPVEEITKIAKARYVWVAAGLMGLFYMAPGLTTALFYKQQNDLHLDTQAQGFLQLITAVGGIFGAVAYASLCRRLNLRILLMTGLALATASTLGYLFYSSIGSAQKVEAFNGFCYSIAELAILDLAIRATPSGSEAFGFSLLMSVRNFALFGTDWFGSALIDRLHWSFNSVVLADAVTTAAAVPLVLLLPIVLVRRRDSQSTPSTLTVALQDV